MSSPEIVRHPLKMRLQTLASAGNFGLNRSVVLVWVSESVVHLSISNSLMSCCVPLTIFFFVFLQFMVRMNKASWKRVPWKRRGDVFFSQELDVGTLLQEEAARGLVSTCDVESVYQAIYAAVPVVSRTVRKSRQKSQRAQPSLAQICTSRNLGCQARSGL